MIAFGLHLLEYLQHWQRSKIHFPNPTETCRFPRDYLHSEKHDQKSFLGLTPAMVLKHSVLKYFIKIKSGRQWEQEEKQRLYYLLYLFFLFYLFSCGNTV